MRARLRPRSRRRGTTLIEILISLAVVLIGMMALFRTLGTAITGSMTASRFSQAQQRAVLVMESIRSAPKLAMTCLLAQSDASTWSGCETICKATTTYTSADSCMYVTLSPTPLKSMQLNDNADSNGQNYFVVQNPSDLTKPRSSVKAGGTDGSLAEIQVVVGWRDDNTLTGTPDHSVVLRSGVYVPVTTP
ncbi:MAG TPA: type II secretion system protein [Polyangia bacterium]|nr:type II secretion system protein [Polyangia bacterium]